MSKRDFGSIKSILHFDFPYYNEPNDGLTDEASSETWTKTGSISLAGTEIPYARNAAPKFGYRCAYFPNTSSYITGTNNHETFNIASSENYEIEVFIKFSGEGTIFKLGDFVLAVDSSGYMTLLGQTASTAFTSDIWQHVLLRIVDGYCTLYLDGVQVLGVELTEDITPENITLGGFVGYMDEFVFRTSAGSGAPSIPAAPYTASFDVGLVGGFGNSSDGDVTISANAQINSYGLINSITDAKTFSVSSWNNGTYTPSEGSELMLHITAPISTTSADYPNVGLYAFARISNIDGVNVVLENEITTENGFDFTLDSSLLSTYRIQAITVPNFKTLTVNSGKKITPLTWNTSKGGGIVAFRCKGDCTINGSIITHGSGAIRYDWCQMENSKLIDRFLCAQGGGIFITCGGTFTTSESARLGATWSGAGDGSNGAAGYGGNSGYSTHTSLGNSAGKGGIGGGGGGGTTSTTAANKGNGTSAGSNGTQASGNDSARAASGGGGCGGKGGNATTNGPAGGGGGGQCNSGGAGGSGTASGNAGTVKGGDSVLATASNKIGGTGGGAPGGNGGNGLWYYSSRNTGSLSGGKAGACIILLCKILAVSSSSISTGGSAGDNYSGAYNCGNPGGGGTGFCYISAEELK